MPGLMVINLLKWVRTRSSVWHSFQLCDGFQRDWKRFDQVRWEVRRTGHCHGFRAGGSISAGMNSNTRNGGRFMPNPPLELFRLRSALDCRFLFSSLLVPTLRI
jgi:hypothetical protein